MANWLKNLFSADTDIETRSVTLPEKVFIEREGPGYEYSEDMPGGMGLRYQNVLNGFYASQNYIELFYSLPEVFAPVHEIAKRVSDANWQFCKDWNDEVDYKDADFNRLFTQPNPLVSFKDFVYQAVCYEILTGKQFFMFNKPKTLTDEYKSIITWSNLPSPKVHIDMKKGADPYTATSMSDFVNEYRLSVKEGTRVFTPEQILPLLHLDLCDGANLNNCKPFLKGADRAIRNLIPVYEARGIIFIKRGAMGLWVSKKSDNSGLVALTPGETKQAAEQVNKDYGLTGNKSTIGVTSVPVEFIKTSMSIAEMQPFDETLADATAIYATLRVPKHLIPSKDQSTFANAAADMKSFYSDVIIPWGKRLAESFTNYMKLKDFRRYVKADYDHVDALQENRKDKAAYEKMEGDTYLIRWQNGVICLNDWIVAVGDTPVSGNELYSKKIFEYTPEELAQVKDVINMKAVVPAVDNSNVNADPSTKLKAV